MKYEFRENDLARLMAKTEVTKDGCWEWTGARERYGFFQLRNKTALAHRVSWSLWFGEIPEGCTLDHLCRNKLCVNPAHLEPVSHKTNIHRSEGLAAKNRLKSHCPLGHPYSKRNTYIHNGKRHCVICKNRKCLDYYYKKKAERLG
jgi:hypothetical protein